MARILYLALQISSAGLYLYTIYYAFSVNGLIAALLSAVFPVISNVYWMYAITMDTGDWMNNYNLACVSVLIIFGLVLAFTSIGKDENLNNY